MHWERDIFCTSIITLISTLFIPWKRGHFLWFFIRTLSSQAHSYIYNGLCAKSFDPLIQQINKLKMLEFKFTPHSFWLSNLLISKIKMLSITNDINITSTVVSAPLKWCSLKKKCSHLKQFNYNCSFWEGLRSQS